jgi:6-phosphogluconate dehydrogenase
MGANMARRLIRAGHQVVAYDRNPNALSNAEKEGGQAVRSLEELPGVFEEAAICWMMLPAGPVTEETFEQLRKILKAGDILIDGGNSYFKDDVRRAEQLADSGIRYLDVGTSGGIWGLERGYSLMIGGDPTAAEELEPIFKSLAPGAGAASTTPDRTPLSHGTADQGYLYCGPAGAGHFVKMVHNGIEYGMMQALAEGFDILKGRSKGDIQYDLDLREIAEVWRRGSAGVASSRPGSWI